MSNHEMIILLNNSYCVLSCFTVFFAVVIVSLALSSRNRNVIFYSSLSIFTDSSRYHRLHVLFAIQTHQSGAFKDIHHYTSRNESSNRYTQQ